MGKNAFTLVELLVVMAILGILAVVSLANFRTSQMKGRDAQRKSDLRQIANALEAYMSDHGGYPAASSGKIKACGCKSAVQADACDWDIDSGSRELCDENNTVYMSKVPGDPLGSQSYCYYSEGNLYRLYAKLENDKDAECLEKDQNGRCLLNRTCAGATYNFGISSPNTKP